MEYFIQRNPFVVPVDDEKIIHEHFGHASQMVNDYSIAQIIAPPGWQEPHQTPDFDEIALIIRGKKQIEIGGKKIMALCRFIWVNPVR